MRPVMSFAKYLLFVGILLAASHSAFAQESNRFFPPRNRGWITIGLDGGTAFQTGDVKIDFKGYGGSLTLAKNLTYSPGALISFDLRGRFLLARSFGFDTKPSYGILNNPLLNGKDGPGNYLIDKAAPFDSSFVYQNFRNGLGELGIEGVFTFNRLREKTGIVLSVFGGLGLDLYVTKINQLDRNFQSYNYLIVKNNTGGAAVRPSLAALRDNSYESEVENPVLTWMPALGLELGYQLSPHFYLGIGHKTTFSRTDLLDGQAWNDQNLPSGNNDLHHYTNLFLRWDLYRAKAQLEAPSIRILQPYGNPYTSNTPLVPLKARILNVAHQADVLCFLNNAPQRFNFDGSLLQSDLALQAGHNELRIVASNPAGRDEAVVTLLYQQAIPTPTPPTTPPVRPPVRNAPEVRIVQPARSPYTTTQNSIPVLATVHYVQSAREVRLLVNGQNARFSLAENLEANVPLREGSNKIEVEARTPDGDARDVVEVIYRPELQPPVKSASVRITTPEQGAITREPEVQLRAQLEQVRAKEELAVVLNGVAVRAFDFDASAQSLRATLRLREGANRIEVVANTANGKASDAVDLRFQKPEPQGPAPIIQLVQPAASNTIAHMNPYGIQANVEHVNKKEDITLLVNGIAVTNFNFEPIRHQLLADVPLKNGANSIQIKALNAFGNDAKSFVIQYQPPAPQKPEVIILEPANNAEVPKAEVLLRAAFKNLDDKNQIRLFLNDQILNNFTFDAKSMAIRAGLQLREGVNIVKIVAQNSDGSAEAAVKLTYIPMVLELQPKVAFTDPLRSPTRTQQATYAFNAVAEHIKTPDQIKIWANGKAIRSFNFDAKTGAISFETLLMTGENKVKITASNGAGVGSAETLVERLALPAPPKPEVIMLEPTTDAEVPKAELMLKCTVKNVTDKNQVQLSLNGKTLPIFSFDSKSMLVQANLLLSEGLNSIKVLAKNSNGEAEASVRVNYKPPVLEMQPKVSFTNPLRSPARAQQALYTFKALVEHIKTQDQIKITANGKPIRTFNFEAKTGAISFDVLLKTGENKVEISVSNTGGTARAEASVELAATVEASNLPKVEIISSSQPVANPFNPDEASTVVLAKVYNINLKEQITVLLNGTVLPGFNFVVKTGNIDFVAKLKRGINTLEIKVKNAQGTDAASTTVRYE